MTILNQPVADSKFVEVRGQQRAPGLGYATSYLIDRISVAEFQHPNLVCAIWHSVQIDVSAQNSSKIYPLPKNGAGDVYGGKCLRGRVQRANLPGILWQEVDEPIGPNTAPLYFQLL